MRLPWSSRPEALFAELPPVDGQLPEPVLVPGTLDYAGATEPTRERPELVRDPVLALQQLERSLVRAHLDAPYAMTALELRRLRYMISFARLTKFEPGAAGPGGQRGRGDVDVTEVVAPWREILIDELTGPLRRESSKVRRLALARDVYYALEAEQEQRRADLIERFADCFSAAELDAEVGYRSLVLVLGGGGGAGFVYLGALTKLLEEQKVPDYIIGSSIGAVLGSFLSRELPVPLEEYIAYAKTLTYRSILGPEPLRRRHGLTSVMSLEFDQFAAPLFRRPDGKQMTLADVAIPYDSVVAGVHQQLFAKLPARFRRQEMAMVQMRSLPVVPIGLGPAMVSRLWQAGSFIDSRVVKPLILSGDDPLTRGLNVLDAASFSAAIPGVLHHETHDPAMVPLLDELLRAKNVAALVDGGAASNVPAEQAWIKMQRGRLGTRNATYLALDCFHPQWDPKHLWLTPITRAIQLQMVRNLPFCDHLIKMAPTLSPVTLAPSPQGWEQSISWGRASYERASLVVSTLHEPIWWEGDEPPAPKRPKARRRTQVAPPISRVLADLEQAVPADGLRRFRDRHFS